MAKRILRFELPVDVEAIVMLPKDRSFLALNVKFGQPCAWIACDLGSPRAPVVFRWIPTGHDVPDEPCTYRGTVVLNAGGLIFHLFEMGSS